MSYVGRGGEKMEWGLKNFGLDVTGLTCCDLGSHVGGFVDGLLQAGAAKVYSVDTCYGTLAWNLRNDERVVVMERTNALHVELPELVDFISCDVGWTKQEKVLPKARSLIKPGGMIMSLLKPQYEADKKDILRGTGRVNEEALDEILVNVKETASQFGVPMRGPDLTPFLGGKGKNPEYFFLLGPF
ncbi:MAG: TlyA family rRNA (cytidine-2'-O)-methyltransferase [Planctomycetes bacterium]|nr:TlyA family rRNA (cytidine-2'-O)-methyltransferase [Planctomycetota bacterium]